MCSIYTHCCLQDPKVYHASCYLHVLSLSRLMRGAIQWLESISQAVQSGGLMMWLAMAMASDGHHACLPVLLLDCFPGNWHQAMAIKKQALCWSFGGESYAKCLLVLTGCQSRPCRLAICEFMLFIAGWQLGSSSAPKGCVQKTHVTKIRHRQEIHRIHIL